MKLKNHILPSIVIAAFIVIGTVSCKQLDKLTMFDLSYDFKFKVPKTEISDVPIDITSPEIETNSDKEFAFHNTAADRLEHVSLTQLTLTIENKAQNFGFVNYIEVYLQAEGLPATLVAWKYDIPKDAGYQLKLDVSEEDLAPFIKKDKVVFRVRTLTEDPIQRELPIEANATFHIDAKILGI